MGNFFLDNQDIQFLFDHIDLKEVAQIQEADTANGQTDYGPVDDEDMVDNYRRVLEIVGQVAAETLAVNAEQVDREGNTLNDDGTVTLNPLVQENLDRMSQADLMGFTLPRKYGGLNCPNLIYTMATEIVSRADTSFMNMFGLQGIAETIHAFANDEIKDEVLSRFATGEVTGAMVLTEPDAGSDLQAVRLRADEDADGNWVLNGVKRFITNGCGEILLVLARSEPEISDGRGLSLFIAERSEKVWVRHLEDKLGIHGSPTCELVFDAVPARLIGERQRGLITYVLALMNGARVSIAAQSLGVAEAAYRLARTYAHTRQQFGGPIEALRAVRSRHPDVQLVIAGKPGWGLGAFRAALDSHPELTDAVRVTGYVSDVDLPLLMAGAEALVYPSLYEGFGLPVAESLACGTPVVTSSVSSLPEVAGEAAVYVDPREVDSIAEGIERALTDSVLRHKLRTDGLARAKLYSPGNVARMVYGVYLEALGHSPPGPAGLE